MDQEEIKEQNKFKKGCLGCLVVISCLMLLNIMYYIATFVFIRPEIMGKVIDKDTNKPIKYVLVKYECGGAHKISDAEVLHFTLFYENMLTNNEGEFKIKKKWVTPEVGRFLGDVIIPLVTLTMGRTGCDFTCWFPGYKKYEIKTEGRKLISGRKDIYLERPKTAEEAVEGDTVYDGNPMNDLSKIVNKDREKFCEIYSYWRVKECEILGEIIGKSSKSDITDKIIKGYPEVAKCINCNYILDNDLKNKCFETQRKIDNLFKYKKNQCLGWYKPR